MEDFAEGFNASALGFIEEVVDYQEVLQQVEEANTLGEQLVNLVREDGGPKKPGGLAGTFREQLVNLVKGATWKHWRLLKYSGTQCTLGEQLGLSMPHIGASVLNRDVHTANILHPLPSVQRLTLKAVSGLRS